MRIYLVIALLFSPLLHGEDESLLVELETAQQLSPIYIGKLEATEGTYGEDYLSGLQKILKYDLNHNGFSKVLHTQEHLERVLRTSEPLSAFQSMIWKKASAAQVIKWKIEDAQLSLYLFSPKTQSLKLFEHIPLTKDLGKDRHQIHKLSDSILNILFQREGSAHSRILYSIQKFDPSLSSSWKSEIWECDPDGSHNHPITDERSYAITPILIPVDDTHSRDRFLYVSYKTGQPKIYLSAKGKIGTPLIQLRGNQLLPAISQKRDKIAFICDASGRADLFLQNLDPDGALSGKPIRLFSHAHSTQASPTFSPDGKKVAFVSDKDGVPRIYTMSTDVDLKQREQPQLLTRRNRENTCPAWSPDGKKLAYSSSVEGVRQIWIYDFETKTESPLTSGPGNKENPSWAPDSLHLVFNSLDGNTSDLYTLNLNQIEPVKITSGPGIKHYPVWGKR